MIGNIINEHFLALEEEKITSGAKHRLKRKYKFALMDEIAHTTYLIEPELMIHSSASLLSMDIFKKEETDDICKHYNLPINNYLNIVDTLNKNYGYNHLREVCLIKEIYILHKELFSRKDKMLLSPILKAGLETYRNLFEISKQRYIPLLDLLFAEIDNDRKLLKKYDNLLK